MTEQLPSRDDVTRPVDVDGDFPRYMQKIATPILIAYEDGVLKTEAEWLEGVDWEAAYGVAVPDIGPTVHGIDGEDWIDHIQAVIAAALGIGETDE